MLTRFIVETLRENTQRNLNLLQGSVRATATNFYDRVYNYFYPPQIQQIQLSYHTAIAPIKARQAQRKAIDTAEQKQFFERTKENISERMEGLEKEITSLMQARFLILWRAQILSKATEKKALEKLFQTKTATELQVEANVQLKAIKNKVNRRSTTLEFLSNLAQPSFTSDRRQLKK